MCVEVDDILTPVFPGVAWKTRLWASEYVSSEIVTFSERRDRPQGFFLGKLKYYAESGFEMWIGDDRPIRHEWGGVYRVGHKKSLFRVIGFFENNTKKDFIALDAFIKRGQKLSRAERERIDEVARVRMDGTWRRRGAPEI